MKNLSFLSQLKISECFLVSIWVIGVFRKSNIQIYIILKDNIHNSLLCSTKKWTFRSRRDWDNFCISLDSTLSQSKSDHEMNSLVKSVRDLNYGFSYRIGHCVWKHSISRISFEWVIRRLIECDGQTTEILSFTLLWTVHNFKQIDERNDSLLSDELSSQTILCNLLFHSLQFSNTQS